MTGNPKRKRGTEASGNRTINPSLTRRVTFFNGLLDKEPSVVVFVLTEKPFEADDVKPLVPAGSDPPGVFRVTRREGIWIPEKLIGHVRRPQ